MKILGIDPGLKATGYGFIDCTNGTIKLIETGTIEPKQKDLIQYRLNKIYIILDDLIKQHKPEVMVIEKLYSHHNHPITSSILGHVRGVICMLCAQRSVELAEFSPKRIRKSVAGNGNASKIQVKRLVAEILGVDAQKLTLDASDALALALGYANINRC
ncbi:MAG: crossover junction endodeoxyribonuclease RuvC [Candidatus Omnitrophica bacterium]|nr:crossover junction endodeoxyribonuclease RuvC [Candidatus Omnitrophota bacterium]MBU1996521.1 crossover junction endodeoxyribonuclease RuvC [Candidatus Omnitrophota bacterium]MBU4333166.1 crossover junction endodeoxyribonuclease RuvC [Candidatus Omnitrophota bacterium]